MTSSENTSEPPDDKFSLVIDDVLAGLQTPHLLFTLTTVTDLILEILGAFTTIDSWFHI